MLREESLGVLAKKDHENLDLGAPWGRQEEPEPRPELLVCFVEGNPSAERRSIFPSLRSFAITFRSFLFFRTFDSSPCEVVKSRSCILRQTLTVPMCLCIQHPPEEPAKRGGLNAVVALLLVET